MDIWNQSILSFSAGLLSSITPRALPMAMVIIVYAAHVWALHGLSDHPEKSVRAIVFQVVFLGAAFFGLSLLLSLPGTGPGEYVLRTQKGFRAAAGGVMLIVGFSHLFSGRKGLTTKANTINQNPYRHLAPFSLLIGLGLAAWWRPGSGLVLNSITLFAATVDGQISGLILLAAHQAGFTLVFLMTGLTLWSTLGAWIVEAKPVFFWIRLSGLLMILFGLGLFLNELHWLAPPGGAAFVV